MQNIGNYDSKRVQQEEHCVAGILDTDHTIATSAKSTSCCRHSREPERTSTTMLWTYQGQNWNAHSRKWMENISTYVVMAYLEHMTVASRG